MKSYIESMALSSRTACGLVVLALVFSSLAGLVCADGPDEKQAMECCRGDAHHCNMPEKTEDCCKPDRTSENPASVETSLRASVSYKQLPETATLISTATAPDAGYRVVPFASPRGSPLLLVNRPLDIPLLN